MWAKYVPCLQVQFATESLISIPQQPGNILIDKTCWFWLRLQNACFTIHSTVIFKLLAKFTAERFGSEWNLTTTKNHHHQSDAFLRKMGGRSSARTLWPVAVAAFPLLSLSLRRKWGYLGEKETKQTIQQLIKETLKIVRNEVKPFVDNLWGCLLSVRRKTVQKSFARDSEGKVDKQ